MRYNSSVPFLGARLTDEEIVWLHQYQPHIFYFHKEGKAYGYFALNAQYAGKRIIDKYEIAIDFARLENRAIPLVYEVGGRIRKTACLYNKPLIDLHQYDDNHLCLIRPDIFWGVFFKRGFTIQYLFVLVSAFLYWQAYFERYGCGPWPGEEHGWEWLKQYIYNGSKR